jgi:MFS family permease
MTLGAVTGGKVMNIGRRNAMFVSIIIGMSGVSITMIFNFYAILIGRFLYGFSAGMFTAISSRFVEETVPIHLYETLSPCLNIAHSFGGISASLIGLILPADKDHKDLLETEKWRIIYFFFPFVMYTVLFLGLLFTIKHDSVKNMVNKGIDAQVALCKIYKNCKTNQDVINYTQYFKSISGSDSTKLTLRDALIDP